MSGRWRVADFQETEAYLKGTSQDFLKIRGEASGRSAEAAVAR